MLNDGKCLILKDNLRFSLINNTYVASNLFLNLRTQENEQHEFGYHGVFDRIASKIHV